MMCRSRWSDWLQGITFFQMGTLAFSWLMQCWIACWPSWRWGDEIAMTTLVSPTFTHLMVEAICHTLFKLKTTNVTPAWPRQPATFSVLTRACGGRRCVSRFASALWCQHTACWTLIGPWAHMPRTPVQPPSCRLPRPRGWYLCTHRARTGACTNLYSQQCEDSSTPGPEPLNSSL